MQWTLLLLLQPLLPLLMVRSQSLAGLSQETIPLFRLTHLGPWDNHNSHATDSPCQGLPSIGATSLTLANQSLERLPSCLPHTLRSLDGSHNLLQTFGGPEFSRLPELRVLTLNHNRISTLHWDHGTPAGLSELDLSHNLLAALPPCSGPRVRNLRSLTLAGNPLRALQSRTFACFPELRLLNLSCSELGHIAHEAFAQEDGGPLAALEVLDLSGTRLERGECGVRAMHAPLGGYRGGWKSGLHSSRGGPRNQPCGPEVPHSRRTADNLLVTYEKTKAQNGGMT